MKTLKLGSATRTIPIVPRQTKGHMTVIRLSGRGGELDSISIPYDDATTEAINAAVIALATRCTFAEGDTITVTEE